MIIKLSSELSVLFSTVLYEAFKLDVYNLIREIEYLTNEEFTRKFANQNHFQINIKNEILKIYFKKSPNVIYLEYVEIKKL